MDLQLIPTYIYVIKCPISHIVVYVGKSINPNFRYTQHSKGRNPIAIWIRAMFRMGMSPKFELIDCTYGSATKLENQYIKYYSSINQAIHNIQGNEHKHICCYFPTCGKKDYNRDIIDEKKDILYFIQNISMRNAKIHDTPIYALREIKRLMNTL